MRLEDQNQQHHPLIFIGARLGVEIDQMDSPALRDVFRLAFTTTCCVSSSSSYSCLVQVSWLCEGRLLL